ncbi:MAG: hypothetical protein P8Y18_11210 [Candidatus Bathyarchaeota archaeon]
MNKKRLLKMTLIGVLIFHLVAISVVFAIRPPEFKSIISKKTITIQPKELTVVSFYVPEGKAFGIEFEIEISQGNILFYPEISSHHETNTENMLEFLDSHDFTIEEFFHEIESQTWSTVFGEETSDFLVDQNWDIFLYNPDSYEKQVEMTISKMWHPW